MSSRKPRRKSYKNMSVTELVKARKELADQINEIDDILALAVEAVGAKVVEVSKAHNIPIRNSKLDPAFAPRVTASSNGNYEDKFGTPSVGNQPPVMMPNPNSKDMMSAFNLFDADGWAREQAEASKKLMEEEPTKTEYDLDSMNEEIGSLTKTISEGLENVSNSKGITGESKESLPSSSE